MVVTRRGRGKSPRRRPSKRNEREVDISGDESSDTRTSVVLFAIFVLSFAILGFARVKMWKTCVDIFRRGRVEYVVGAIAIGALILAYICKKAENAAFFRGQKGREGSQVLLRLTKMMWVSLLVGVPASATDRILVGFFPGPCCLALCTYAAFEFSTTVEQTGGVRDDQLFSRKWNIWLWFARRFSLKIEKSVELDPKRQYIFGNHPHAILPFGSMVALNVASSPASKFYGFDSLFPGLSFRTLAATFCFYVPVYRELCLYAGIVDAARYSARRVLRSGKSLMLIPGGATEALYCRPDEDIVYLTKRYGFVKLSLETGCDLVPIFSFNETNCWKILNLDEKNGGSLQRFCASTLRHLKQRFQRITGLSLPIVLNAIPMKSKITVVVGRPIPVKKVEKPTEEQTRALLETYIGALRELHEKNRARLSPGKPPLRVV